MSIEVKNVTKIYGEQKALNDVSFEIGGGEIVGFLGPNGAGKSTMMKIITCFIPQTSGIIKVCGYDVTEDPIDVKRNVGYLPEHNPLYLDMYVKEYLDFVGGVYKIDNRRARVKEMVDMVGLGLEQNKKIGALSKGYRQRVGLAQAMIHNPKVLILDEPTTGLDPNQLEEIRNLIKEIGKEKTIMLSTHIMQEVEAICDKTIIVNKGVIVANETTKELQQRNKQGIVVTVEFDKPIDNKQLEKIEGVTKIAQKSETVLVMEIKADNVRNNIFQFAMKHDLTVLTMQKETQSLENVFKSLTK
ncbi:gliding motility-associated ABC transporter ATP-binding subunit GldA [Vicingus serpentipes]|uniref:Gliding motility-associated ABC transporter ATP-binding subunit GldA n=1 Tax=Vicingus serpentipes TaxID=1926625 RepID=A0A5C6RQX9_9FLAO|nr:gliding motility-associated ABC transporter ATP-binding subunit GldA [Vicingus serpentipes]TXB64653.1 gliding motility-associated ABC transporter ATP-binding subunit GldA [Vicingus serpentipes]